MDWTCISGPNLLPELNSDVLPPNHSQYRSTRREKSKMSSDELRSSENPRKWDFTWEAQSHIPNLRLFLFNPSFKPSIQCKDLKVNLNVEQSLLTVTWFEAENEDEDEVSVRVPIPRALIDVGSPVHFRALDDHIDVKLVLLLPVDHPILANFEDESHRENVSSDDLQPLFMDSELRSLSSSGGVHLYCRNCSAKLTESLSCFVEMPSVDWREVADNWFGSCCCSFGGISEKLVTRYASSYTCVAGTCLLNSTSVILCKDDLVDCKFPERDETREKYEHQADVSADNCSTKAKPDNRSNHGRVVCCENQSEKMRDSNVKSTFIHPSEDDLAEIIDCKVSEEVILADGLSSMFLAMISSEDTESEPKCCVETMDHVINHDIEDCSCENSETFLKEQKHITIEHRANQKPFVNGFLGNAFMMRSSYLSNDVQWILLLCPHCLCLLGAYPCGSSHAPVDGVRLFKCYVSTCLPVGGFNDIFRKYTLERMFTYQLLESANDELSFRVVVKDLQTRSPMLQIVILNPNSWCYTGYCFGMDSATEPVSKESKIDLYPSVKVLFSNCSGSTESQLRVIKDWETKSQADEVYMLMPQIEGLIESLESAKETFPPSFTFFKGLSLSTMRR